METQKHHICLTYMVFTIVYNFPWALMATAINGTLRESGSSQTWHTATAFFADLNPHLFAFE